MDANTKYKRWGWGAVIGLIAVILVAGLIIAVSIKSPKKADEIASNDGDESALVSGEVDKEKADENSDAGDSKDEAAESDKSESDEKTEEKKTETKDDSVTSDTSNKSDSGNKSTTGSDTKSGNGSMPKSGPTENVLAILAFAVIVGLISYNVVLAKDFTLSVK